MKLITATLATAVLLALAGTVPAAHAQDQQQQDKQHPPKQQQKPAHPQQEQKPAHPQQQQKPARQQQQPRQQEQRQQQPRQQERQQQPRQQQEQQKQQQKTAQHQQQQEQKQQRTQQKQEQKAQHQQEQSRPESRGQQPEQRAQQNQSDRGGHARGDAQQTAHYEQAHMRHYQPRANEHEVRIPDNDFHERFGRDHRFRMARPVIVDGFPRFQYSGFWFVLEEPWPDYWYDSDDFYVTYDSGLYWLCDYDDPGVQVQLVVVTL